MSQRLVGVFAAPQSLLPTLADAFQASAAQTGMTFTASLLAVALAAPFVGGISDAFGRRRLIVSASLALVVPLLAGLAPSLGWLIGFRFLQGLLLPFIFAVTVAYIADECPGAEGVRATGIYSVGSIIGGFSGRFNAVWTAQSSIGRQASSCSPPSWIARHDGWPVAARWQDGLGVARRQGETFLDLSLRTIGCLAAPLWSGGRGGPRPRASWRHRERRWSTRRKADSP